MKNVKVKTGRFTSLVRKGVYQAIYKNKKRILTCCSILALTGCVTSSNQAPLALAPPVSGDLYKHQTVQISSQSIMNDQVVGRISRIEPAAGAVYPLPRVVSSPIVEEAAKRLALSKSEPDKGGCRLKDRFDRKALIAYEWSRNRLALDMDGGGIGLAGVKKVQGVHVDYTLHFQPEKTKAQRCRYHSSWQGMIGSGYNELFVRDKDTVWQQLRAMRKDAERFIDDRF